MGPTASGKSALALELAQVTQAHVINADALQVYGDLQVLSNRPGPADLRLAPHALFGHVDGAVRYNVGAWLEAAQHAIASTWAAGRNVIVVGGTGLYFKALTEGLAAVPPIDEDVRARLSQEAAEGGLGPLYQRLQAMDPEGALRLAPGDRARILRALEVVISTGQSLPALHADARNALRRDEWLGVCLSPDREMLRARIAARFSHMLEHGALLEAAALARRGLDSALPVMRAHGAPWLMAHLAGDLSLDEAAALSVRDTQRYAKRQRTWMAHQMPGWHRLEGSNPGNWAQAALEIWGQLRPKHG